MILKLSLHFLQVFWLWSNLSFKLQPILSVHPVKSMYVSTNKQKSSGFTAFVYILYYVQQCTCVQQYTHTYWLKKKRGFLERRNFLMFFIDC